MTLKTALGEKDPRGMGRHSTEEQQTKGTGTNTVTLQTALGENEEEEKQKQNSFCKAKIHCTKQAICSGTG
ncbi:hypothetical protein P7K49_034710, partial [Saguinus oedipus]